MLCIKLGDEPAQQTDLLRLKSPKVMVLITNTMMAKKMKLKTENRRRWQQRTLTKRSQLMGEGESLGLPGEEKYRWNYCNVDQDHR